jgi:hypothetical protein
MRLKLSTFDFLFGCWHRRLSFPFSVKPGQRGPSAAHHTGTYVVCLKCGKEFPYDWENLGLVSEVAGDRSLKRRTVHRPALS